MTGFRLRPATIEDRRRVYAWLAESDATAEMMGPPVFSDHPIPSYAEFCADYDEAAFEADGDFRIFIIVQNGEEVGVIHYWIQDGVAELDLWIGSRRNWGRGLGSRALREVCDQLERQKLAHALVIRPSARNERAVSAYKKAGFEDYEPNRHRLPAQFVTEGLDYRDAVVLARRLRN